MYFIYFTLSITLKFSILIFFLILIYNFYYFYSIKYKISYLKKKKKCYYSLSFNLSFFIIIEFA